jgi:hypothetical protein
MRYTLTGIIASFIIIISATAAATPNKEELQLRLNGIVNSGDKKTFEHGLSIVLADGFWAKAGSDVTVTIVPLPPLIQMNPPPKFTVNRDPDVGTGSNGDKGFSVDIGQGVSLPNPASYYAVNTIDIEEKNNNPCVITLWGHMVDPAYESKDRILASYALEQCRDLAEKYVSKQELGSNIKLPPSKNWFLNGVFACGGHSGISNIQLGGLAQEPHFEIKGLQVNAVSLDPKNLNVKSVGKFAEFIRPNCGTGGEDAGWTKWANCDPGYLLTGVYVDSYKDKYFTGLSANCKKPKRFGPPSKPVKDKVGY